MATFKNQYVVHRIDTIFVFVDRNNEGIYSLVHSTVLDEIKSSDWKSQEI